MGTECARRVDLVPKAREENLPVAFEPDLLPGSQVSARQLLPRRYRAGSWGRDGDHDIACIEKPFGWRSAPILFVRWYIDRRRDSHLSILQLGCIEHGDRLLRHTASVLSSETAVQNLE